MATEYIEKQAAIEALGEEPENWIDAEYDLGTADQWRWDMRAIKAIPPADVRPVPPGGIGEMSDGYHTFNGLYYQRKVLFASLVNAYKENAWKSYRHEDGELCFGGGWFIVGVETPKGNYTYHYENKDFDLFDCKELPVAPHWDGHTEGDVTRLLSLPDVRPVVRGQWIVRETAYGDTEARCSECSFTTLINEPGNGLHMLSDLNYCPWCGSYNGGVAE